MFTKSVDEIIRKRHSVRNFTDKEVSEEVLGKIFAYIKEIDNPFQGDVTIYMIKKEDFPNNVKLGTYGMVNGGKYFLVGVSGESDEDKLSLGYMLEKAVLFLTDLGLGSVWLGGTFNKSDFESTVSLLGSQKVRIVIPFGFEGGKKSLLGILAGNNQNKRKDFEKLFYDGDSSKPLIKEKAGVFLKPLELLRLAPSGINKQPWRCIKTEDQIDFYLSENSKLSLIDMGIGLSHFLVATEEEQIEGDFIKLENKESQMGMYIGTFKKS